MNQESETLEYDVVVVGAGPAGLSMAIRLLQLNASLRVCVLEKSAEIGGHVLSGAVIDPAGLDDLLPNWQEDPNAPACRFVHSDAASVLYGSGSITLPHYLIPNSFKNKGCVVLSLSELCRYLALKAEALGCDVLPGFSADQLLVSDQRVVGVLSGAFGLDERGAKTEAYVAPVRLLAKQLVLSEGCGGSLTRQLRENFPDCVKRKALPRYALGIKEIWQQDDRPDEELAIKPGQVEHFIGWPLVDKGLGGGGFAYGLAGGKLAVGLVIDLPNSDEHKFFDSVSLFEQFKNHPKLSKMLIGKPVSYGARCLYKGGFSAHDAGVYPGALLIGDSAGTLSAGRLKGVHTAMDSAICAAQVLADYCLACDKDLSDFDVGVFNQRLGAARKKSAFYTELKSLSHWPWLLSLLGGKLFSVVFKFAGLFTVLFEDEIHSRVLSTDKKCSEDTGQVLDRSSLLHLSNTDHRDNQPCHLQLNSELIAANKINSRNVFLEGLCPAGVYQNQNEQLVVSGQNCLHCKACELADPEQLLRWHCPEPGGGPNYRNM